MQSVLKCLLLAVCVAATLAVPAPMTGSRQRRYAYPARAMMFSGYFRGQYPQQHGFRHYVPRNYEPEGAMTAFAAGNTVSAGSFLGNGNQPGADCTQCNGNGNYPSADEDTNGPPPEVIPTTNEGQPPYTGEGPSYPEGGNGEGAPEEAPATEASVDPNSDVPEEIPEETAAPIPPPTNGNGYGNGNGNGNGNGHRNGNGNGNGNGHRNGNGNGRGHGAKTPSTPRSDEDDAEEEDDSLPGSFPPGKKPRGRGNFYNTYFPMIFGSYPGSRNGGGGEPFPGAATAIANSFSTGRGAVATSHATAYGGPHYLGSNGSRKGNSSPDSNRPTPGRKSPC